MALPQPLLKAFAWPDVRTRATVDGVVTVVDALALSEGRVTLDEGAVAAQRAADNSVDHDDPIEEVFEDQLACADLVVLSKSDLVSSDALAAIEARLAAVLRPGVRIVRSHGALLPAVLIGLNSAAEDDMAARAGHHGEEEEHDHDDFDSIVVTPSPADSVDAMRCARQRCAEPDRRVARQGPCPDQRHGRRRSWCRPSVAGSSCRSAVLT